MANEIDIDFDKLNLYIKKLEKLLTKLDEPSYKKLDFYLGDSLGSGFVLDYLYDFCNNTIDFYNCTYDLISNTITYLKSVQKLKDADLAIANSL